MDSTDRENLRGERCHSESGAIAFGFGKSQLTQHSYFPNSTATEKDTACATTTAISRSVLPTPPPNCRPDSGAATRFRGRRHGDGFDR